MGLAGRKIPLKPGQKWRREYWNASCPATEFGVKKNSPRSADSATRVTLSRFAPLLLAAVDVIARPQPMGDAHIGSTSGGPYADVGRSSGPISWLKTGHASPRAPPPPPHTHLPTPRRVENAAALAKVPASRLSSPPQAAVIHPPNEPQISPSSSSSAAAAPKRNDAAAADRRLPARPFYLWPSPSVDQWQPTFLPIGLFATLQPHFQILSLSLSLFLLISNIQ